MSVARHLMMAGRHLHFTHMSASLLIPSSWAWIEKDGWRIIKQQAQAYRLSGIELGKDGWSILLNGVL